MKYGAVPENNEETIDVELVFPAADAPSEFNSTGNGNSRLNQRSSDPAQNNQYPSAVAIANDSHSKPELNLPEAVMYRNQQETFAQNSPLYAGIVASGYSGNAGSYLSTYAIPDRSQQRTVAYPESTSVATGGCMMLGMGFGGCAICLIIVIIVVVVLVSVGTSNNNSSTNFVSFVVIDGANCNGNGVYEVAYPVNTCLPYYNSTTSKMYFNNNSDATVVYYSDMLCQKEAVVEQKVFPYQDCFTIAGYAGYSQLVSYLPGNYQILIERVNGTLPATGFADSKCAQTFTEVFTVPYDTCLPQTPTTSVKYTYQAASPNSAAQYTINSYDASVHCVGLSSAFSQAFDSSTCSQIETVDTVSPYRNFNIPDLFTN